MIESDVLPTVLALLESDNFPADDPTIYSIRTLFRTVHGERIPYGFSIHLFGVTALRGQYAGKWSCFLDVPASFPLPDSASARPHPDIARRYVWVPVAGTTSFLTALYHHCRRSVVSAFDCCSRFEECSAVSRCVNPLPDRGLFCSYRKKLESGVNFHLKKR